jgi:hypothetical protein
MIAAASLDPYSELQKAMPQKMGLEVFDISIFLQEFLPPVR